MVEEKQDGNEDGDEDGDEAKRDKTRLAGSIRFDSTGWGMEARFKTSMSATDFGHVKPRRSSDA